MLTLRRVAPREWEFVYPQTHRDVMNEFHSGCELYEAGEPAAAEAIFENVLAQMPDHIDAIHHLAMVLSDSGRSQEARSLWEQAVRIGRKAFPPEFDPQEDRLEWGWLDNRPFLRALHGLGFACLWAGDMEEALKIFQELLQLNPNDNQGNRTIAGKILVQFGRLDEALDLYNRFPEDIMPETLYGRALVLFRLGRKREANRALRQAIEDVPLVARELLKARHRLPKSAIAGFIVAGGADQAYYYWQEWGRQWKGTPGALEWLREYYAKV
ncbi:tetratricopeptide repeat protein [Chloroflexota bacterium]